MATSLPGWPKHPAQPKESEEIERLKKTLNDLGKIIHDMTVAQQAAWIEWQHGKGAELSLEFASSMTSVLYHPGAAKYFAEKGFEVATK